MALPPTIDLVGPSSNPALPQITPAAVNTAVNTALATLFGGAAQVDGSGNLVLTGLTIKFPGGEQISVDAQGHLFLTGFTFPIVDPHNVNQVWLNANALAISAG